MSKNQEIKFIRERAEAPEEVLRAIGFATERKTAQEDVYSFAEGQFFKLRINDGMPAKLLRYNRLTSPVIRESRYESYELQDKSSRDTARLVFDNIAIAGCVRKLRRQFEAPNLLLNFDTVFEDGWENELYRVVEVEYSENAVPSAKSIESVQQILNCFGVRPFELLPYSNIHMVNMLKMSKAVRSRLGGKPVGKLILIDGGSGTGKSTIKDLLTKRYKLKYARRETTREPRADDAETNDYRFVSSSNFNRSALLGEYIEFRDFLFGMSYGLPWSEFVDSLSQGDDVMALINLGNGHFTKRLFPAAKLVLLYAGVDTIRKRLLSRGGLTIEQIEERIENNRLATSYIGAYDLAIDTSQHSPIEVAEKIIAPG